MWRWTAGALAPFVMVALTAAPSSRATAGRPEDRPNVLIIVTDDQRAGTLRQMPATLRWFVRGGTRFPRAFTTTPLCCPSRASIFTGRYVHNHGVRNQRDLPAFDHRSTIQFNLKSAGYRTAIVGKYLNGWPLEQRPPHFQQYAILSDGYRDATFGVNGDLRKVRRYSTGFIEDTAIRFLSRNEWNDQDPWLLYVAPFAPHPPSTPAARYRRAPVPGWAGNPAVSESDISDKPPFVRARGRFSLRDAKALRRLQLRALMSVDDLVARIMRTLGALDERRDTLAIFLSDNGLLWGEHGLGGKAVPYEQAVHVPLLVRWTGQVDPGETDQRLVANIDLAPTIYDAVGLGVPPSSVDGWSLLGNHSRSELLLEYPKPRAAISWDDIPSWGSLLTASALYTEYYGEDEAVPSFREYYDLTDDPWQLTNLFATDGIPPADALDLATRLASIRRCRGTEGGPTSCP